MIKRLELTENDVLIVSMKIGNLPMHRATKLLLDCKDQLKEVFPNNAILIMPNSTSISIVKPA